MISTKTLRALLGLLAAFAIVAAACTSDDEPAAPDAPSPPATDAPAPAEPSEPTEPTEPTPAEPAEPSEPTAPEPPPGFTYTVALFDDILTENYWAYWGPNTTNEGQYVLGPTKPTLYDITFPAIAVTPDLAATLPPEPVAEGDGWAVTVDLREGYLWSDGTPVTALDVQFTFETVRDMQLGGNWLASYPYSESSNPRLLEVTAVGDTSVKLVFDNRPGLAVWPHNVGTGPIMPKHAWEDTVAEALTTEDPATTLYGSDPSVDVSAGESVYAGREEGAFINTTANSQYFWSGAEIVQYSDGTIAIDNESYYGPGAGDVVTEYSVGPFSSNNVFSIYSDQPAAVLALKEGETDILLTPLGLQRGLLNEALGDENLSVALNPANNFFWLAFNMKQSPGKYLGFRQAMAFMIDKEYFSTNVVQGSVFPVYVILPEGNRKWYNPDVADAIAQKYVGLSEQDRVNLAVAALQADGFTWETPPEIDEDGNVVLRSMKGLIDPEGQPVAEQEIITTTPARDPIRASYALWIEGWAEELGIRARANPEGFGAIFARVWPGVGVTNTFDMLVLGFDLGNPALPTFHETLFHSRNLAEVNDGWNAFGYSDPEFDALADAMLQATTEADVFDALWQMEQRIADTIPMVPLYGTPLIEFYRKDVQYPFTDTLNGLQAQNGAQGLVVK